MDGARHGRKAGADARQWRRALRELEEADQANGPAMALLRELIDQDARPRALEPPP